MPPHPLRASRLAHPPACPSLLSAPARQVLESFLQDFEGKIGLGDADELDETSAMELSYPTALEDSETLPATTSYTQRAEAAHIGGASPRSRAAPRRPASAGGGMRGAPAVGVDAALLAGARFDDYADDDLDEPLVPFSRPQTAPPSRSRLGPGGLNSLSSASRFSSASLIRRLDSTPGRIKSDPVSMHARRQQQWSSNAFLVNSPRRNVRVSAPSPRTAAAGRRRPPPEYVVPTAKRRDDVVWETRQRMRAMQTQASTPRRQKKMVPNAYVPAPEKRRDDLRWQARRTQRPRATCARPARDT